jgi:NAD(P)-dependent dehydrogenase (short-subunit alcohol dehydrogenase family)
MDLGLAGRHVLVTGASKGIGRATAEAFAEEGCALTLVARQSADLDAAVADLAQRTSAPVRALAADLRDPADIAKVVAALADVDVLVNNAGDIPGGDLQAVQDEALRRGWDLKVFGYISLCRAAYAAMKARGSGVIVNVIGTGGERPDFNYIAGSAGNAALMAFTRALGSKSLADGLRVVGINPGPTDTDRIRQLARTLAKGRLGSEERADEIMAGFPGGRVAKTREIGDLAAFLASDRSGYTTGTIVTVDGGLSA